MEKLRILRRTPGRSANIFRLLDGGLWLLLFAGVLLFILWPLAEVLLRSLLYDGRPSLRLFQELVPANLSYLRNSLLVAGLSTLAALAVAVCIALYESFARGRLRRLVVPLLLLTMISPPFVSTLAYIILFGRRGFITHTLLGISSNPYGWHGIVVMQALGEISITALLIIGVLHGLDGRLLQASRDLGASVAQTLRRVVLPLLLPGIGAAGFVAFIRSLADFGTPIIIGGNFSVLATEIYMTVISSGDLGKAAVLSVMLLVPALIAMLFFRRTESMGVLSAMGSTGRQHRQQELVLQGTLAKVLAIVTWLFFAVMLLQFLTIFLTAVTRYTPAGYIFTLEHLNVFHGNQWRSILRSVCYALTAGIVSSVFGVLLAYYLERRHMWGRRLLELLSSLPYVVPGTLFGIGYVLAFHDEPLALTGTAIIVVINCIFRQLIVAVKAGAAVLSNVSPDLENAARDLGTPRIFILRDILLPLLKPAIFVSFVNTFTATMMTIGAIIFIISPNAKVATVELFDSLKQGVYGDAAVFALLLTLITVAANLLFGWLLRSRQTE